MNRVPLFRRVWKRVPGTNPPRYRRAWQRIKITPTLRNIKVDAYLTGNIVPVRKVPKQHREAYRDTLARFALACHKAGYGPDGTKGKRHVNSSYRHRAEQEALFAQNMISAGSPRPGRPLTAVPGRSPHERGIGLDVPSVRFEQPLITECRRLGLMDDVASEQWHLTNHVMLSRGA